MKPPVFDYAAPDSVRAALDLLVDWGGDAKVIAGGQSLIPMLNMRLARPSLLVDITRIDELAGLGIDRHGALHVGAAVRQADVLRSADVWAGWPLLAAAVRKIGHPHIRSRGTVCGSLAHHDPAAELPAAAVALDAQLVIAGPTGRRRVPAADFFVGIFQTVIEPDELLVEVVFPPVPAEAWGFDELARRHGDFATIGVATRLRADAGALRSARIVFCGAGTAPVRVPQVEQLLVGARVDEPTLQRVRTATASALRPPGDVHASADYRREAAAALLDRALRHAWERLP